MDSAFGFLLGAGIAIILLFLALIIVGYVLTAIGLQTLAKRSQIEYSWLAWIPVANLYLLGLLIKDKSKIPYIEWILPIGSVLAGLLSGTLATLVSIALYVVLIMSYYELYRKYSKSYVLLTIFSAILPFVIPFFIFAIRNNELITTNVEPTTTMNL